MTQTHEHVCHCAANPYLPVSMRLVRVVDEVDDRSIKSFDLAFVRPEDAERFSYTPGQFCELSLLGVGEAPPTSPPTEEVPALHHQQAGVVTSRLQRSGGRRHQPEGPWATTFPWTSWRARTSW